MNNTKYLRYVFKFFESYVDNFKNDDVVATFYSIGKEEHLKLADITKAWEELKNIEIELITKDMLDQLKKLKTIQSKCSTKDKQAINDLIKMGLVLAYDDYYMLSYEGIKTLKRHGLI